MHRSEDQTGGRQPLRPTQGAGISSPLLLVLLAVAAVMVLALATTQVAVAASLQAPPMVLPAEAGASSTGRDASSGNWIVGGVPGAATTAIATRSGAKPIDSQLGTFEVTRGKARLLAGRLKAAGRLVYAEPDVAIQRSSYPMDKFADLQWWLNRIVNPGDVTPPAVTSQSPLIAIIEESLDRQHPDLADANLTGAKSLGPEADWHGTAVAGIIGSPGEMLGIRGVWPGARMRLFPSGLTCSTASKAVTRAVNRGAAVINMSYTFPDGTCFTHLKATQYAVRKGVVPVAAAGNTGDSGNAPVRPATDPHVLSVGAVDDASNLAPFSTRNPGVDLVAPGARVLAPYVTGQAASGASEINRTWAELSGTSFSAPMVTAAAAWLRQARPNLGNLQISRLLTNSATDLGDPGRDPSFGAGMLNIERSLVEPTPPSDPYEPNDDIHWIDGSLIKPKSPYLWRAGKGRRRVITATLSRAKDPADVYRVSIPARRRIIVNATQLEGDVTLSALKPRSKRIARPGKNLIVRSNRPYPKTEGILVRNLKRRPQTIWISLGLAPAHTGDAAAYKLKVARR